MKKKPYVLSKAQAVKVSDPIGRFHAEEDERILGNLIAESKSDVKTLPKTYKKKDQKINRG